MENQDLISLPAEEVDKIISFIKNQKGKSKSKEEMIKDIVEQIKPLIEGARGKNLSVQVEGGDGKTIPQININIPDIVVPEPKPVKVELPEIKIPEIKVPKAEVEVRIPEIKVPKPEVNVEVPEIKVPEVKMPKEMEVKGFQGFVSKVLEALKGVFRVEIEGNDKENPLMVKVVGGLNIPQVIQTGRGGGSAIMAEIKDQVSPRGEVGTGIQSVGTAGTAEQLSPVSIPCKRVFVQALESNTAAVTVGDSHVVAALAGRRGMTLYPTQGEWFNVNNLNLLYVDVMVNGEGVHFFWEN
jgi:hypothetical protein